MRSFKRLESRCSGPPEVRCAFSHLNLHLVCMQLHYLRSRALRLPGEPAPGHGTRRSGATLYPTAYCQTDFDGTGSHK